jgi:transposase InsO family protein
MPHHQKAFDELKKSISDRTILKYYDVKKDVTITCDSSSEGLGAALLQDGQPIHFASRSLTDTEKHYAQIEKELLAVVFACEKFRQYIYGKQVTVETDHKPLITIVKKPMNDAPMRLQKLLMRLQHYDLCLNYKPGKEMHIADALSRAFLTDVICETQEEEYEVLCVSKVSPKRLVELAEATSDDIELRKLTSVIQNGWDKNVPKCVRPYKALQDELVIQDGVVMKGQRVVVPKRLRTEYLKQLHSSHNGAEATKRRAREAVFWLSMNSDIENYVSICAVCNAHKYHQPKEEMVHFPIPELPWQIVASDLFTWQSEEYLVTVDSYSGWYEVNKLQDTSAKTVILKLRRHFSVHGIPDIIISDSGPQFTCVEFAEFCSKWDIQHLLSSPDHHQANGLAERAVQSAKSLLDKCKSEDSDFFLALLNSRNIPRDNNLGSPAQRLLSRKTRTLVTQSQSLLKPKVINNVQKNLKKVRDEKKRYYDKQSHNLKPLKQGDTVRIQTTKGYNKLGVVKQQANAPRSYIVETNGRKLRRNRKYLLKVNEKTNETQPSTQTPQQSTKTAKQSTDIPQQWAPQTPVKTGRGRLVKNPSWMNDYVK